MLLAAAVRRSGACRCAHLSEVARRTKKRASDVCAVEGKLRNAPATRTDTRVRESAKEAQAGQNIWCAYPWVGTSDRLKSQGGNQTHWIDWFCCTSGNNE